MGNFYTNITLRASPDEVIPILKALGRDAYVGFEGSFAVVCDRDCERQDLDIIASLAVTLAVRLGRGAVSVLNHDDSALLFGLFADGVLACEYGLSRSKELTAPKTAKREFARRLHATLNTSAVERSLTIPWWIRPIAANLILAIRHEQLAAEFGLPVLSVGSGFNYVDRGDLPRARKQDFRRV